MLFAGNITILFRSLRLNAGLRWQDLTGENVETHRGGLQREGKRIREN